MGNRYELSVIAADEQWANEKIDIGIAEIQRIENCLPFLMKAAKLTR